ncbi:MAG: hypothetical protein DRG78_21465 [Epsilonproteobacteria bacterium]|nr:MAG: hypothetical protein DRG78_21465 [Campylobacterota bacterium]
MINERHSLPLRTFVGHYWIQEMVYLGKDTICYRAEDMRLNRQVLLREYYPSDIAKRHVKQNDTYMVDVEPVQHDIFTAAKKQIRNTYTILKELNHGSIASFKGFFEAHGTIYMVFDYIDTKTIQLSLEQKIKYSENEIGVFTKSLVVALTALQYHDLNVCHIQPDMIHMNKKKNAVISGLTDFIPLMSSYDEHIIYDIGLLMYVMLKGTPLEADEEVEELISDDNYSTVMCELINRMLSPKLSNRPKSLQEIQTLLSIYNKEEPLSQPVLSETKSNPFLFVAKLGSIVMILVFTIYLLYNQLKESKSQEISTLKNVQSHKVSEIDNAEEQRTLGEINEKVYHNIPKAVQLYKKAANQGNLYAQLRLGNLYKKGVGIRRDDQQAAHWFLQAAKQGDSVAQYNIAYFYYNGIGIAKNKKEAEKWFEKAAEHDSDNATYADGKIYYEGDGIEEDYKKAFQWYVKAAQKGDIGAQYKLANGYDYGEGQTKNYKDTMFWYAETDLRVYNGLKEKPLGAINIAAFLPYDNDSKEYTTGYMYEKKKDDKQALKWYLKAAKQGDHRAQYKLGFYYLWGENIKHNHVKSMYWLKQAAAQRNVHAYFGISYLYRANQGIPKDESLAFQWCRKSAKNGDRTAQKLLGSYYEVGTGTEINYNKALYWYEKAAARGNDDAHKLMIDLKKKLKIKS